MDRIDWEDLRHFTALAEALNLGRAAARLGTSQVTVLRRVKALETALGTMLFLRRREGHQLTAEGAELLRSTREAELLIDEGTRRVAARDRVPGGRVRVATTELAANWILLPALPAFVARNPDIAVEIDASPEALRLTDDAETIALRFHRPARGPLRIRKVGVIGFSLYRAASDDADTPARYLGWAGTFAEIGLARWLRGCHEGPAALSLTTLDGHLRAVRAGLGISALPDFIARHDPTLVPVPTASAPFVLEAWLVVPEQIAAQAKVRSVAKLIETAVAALS
jgi:DNA-binding transcriptional LysR family regulator